MCFNFSVTKKRHDIFKVNMESILKTKQKKLKHTHFDLETFHFQCAAEGRLQSG